MKLVLTTWPQMNFSKIPAAALAAFLVALSIPPASAESESAAALAPICETNYDEGFGYAYGECWLNCGIHSAGVGTSHAFGGSIIGLPPQVTATNGCVPDAGCSFVAGCFGTGSYNHRHGQELCTAEANGLPFSNVNIIGGCSAADDEQHIGSATFARTPVEIAELTATGSRVTHIWLPDFNANTVRVGDIVCTSGDASLDQATLLALGVPAISHCLLAGANGVWMFAGSQDFYPVAFGCLEAACTSATWTSANEPELPSIADSMGSIDLSCMMSSEFQLLENCISLTTTAVGSLEGLADYYENARLCPETRCDIKLE